MKILRNIFLFVLLAGLAVWCYRILDDPKKPMTGPGPDITTAPPPDDVFISIDPDNVAADCIRVLTKKDCLKILLKNWSNSISFSFQL